MANVLTIAQAFLELAHRDRQNLTNMQMQKLVFFAHGLFLAAYDKPLLDDQIKAWNFGPVIPPLYNELKKYGSGAIVEKVDSLGLSDLQPREREAVCSVWKTFGNSSAWELSNISHAKDSPWDVVWNQKGKRFNVIDNDITKKYYKTLLIRKEN